MVIYPKEFMSKVLGLDIGANSVGWALIDDNLNKIVDIGVRVFPEGVSDYDTSKEKSKMANRREARSARRRFWRRRRRLNKLLHLFKEYDMSQMNVQQFNEMDPYYLRRKALDEMISLDEFARIIYHMSKRRGYFDISSAAGSAEEKKERGVVKAGISELYKKISESCSRTLGEYFSTLKPEEVRIRSRWTERKMFQDEFLLIWENQSKFYPDKLKNEFKDIIYEVAFLQRPLKSSKKLIGYCEFEPKHQRAPKSHTISQLFRMYQVVNNLTISGGSRILPEQQELTEDERIRLIDFLSNHEKIELKDGNKELANKLKLFAGKKYITNYDDAKKIHGINTYCKIKNALKNSTAFSKKPDKLNEDDLRLIWRIIYEENSFEKRFLKLKKYCKLDDGSALKLADISLEPGYASLSLKAMAKMLPFLKNGMKYHEAALAAGYRHSLDDRQVEEMEYLPDPVSIRNPVVTVALHQVKLVVNELIKIYGKPDIVRIEMARDMKKTKDERDEIRKKNKANEDERDLAKKEIANYFKDMNISNKDFPRETYILKYRLWKQQDETCVYSGRNISISQLFSGETDIDHILPYSRTLDDSFMNKVVCFKSENSYKTNKIPWEAFAHFDGKYEAILDRVKNWPYSKAKKFKMDKKMFADYLGEEGMISRYLNDTRYISREAKSYLQHVCTKVNVANGTTTSYLRHLWGLNTILSGNGADVKNRHDHRHHAIDAAIIALTNQSALQKLSTYIGITGDHEFLGIDEDIALREFPMPWEDFRINVADKAANIIVSHKVNKRAKGQLHEETYYGLRKNPDQTFRIDDKGMKLYHVRKALDLSLTHNQIKSIVEPKIKEAIFDRLIEFGINPESKFESLPKEFFREPLIVYGKNGNFYIPKSVRIAVASSTMKNIRGYNLWVETGKNHHMIIYKDIDSGKQKGKIVTLFDAVQRKKNGLPVIDKVLGPNDEFMYSLQINELIFTIATKAGNRNKYDINFPEGFDLKNKDTYHKLFNAIYRVQTCTDGKITFRQHNTSILELKDKNGKTIAYPGRLISTPNDILLIKLIISPSGFLEIADE